MENLFLMENILDISLDAYLDDKGVLYLSYSDIVYAVIIFGGERLAAVVFVDFCNSCCE